MTRFALVWAACWLSVGLATAEPKKIDRTIGTEPAYRTKAPKYGLLHIGPEGNDRVWLVLDGDSLYVDRNGNGDLTEAGEKVEAEKKPGRDPAEDGYSFVVGDVTVGGRTHKGLGAYFAPLKRYADSSIGKRPDVQAVLAKDAKAMAARLNLDVEVSGMKGGGLGGRVTLLAGPVDLGGVLQFADAADNAPIIHCDGPLQVTFYAEKPTLRVGRGSEFVLVVGTPGVGPGTFAMLGYEDTVPKDVKPMAALSLPSAEPDGAPLKELFEIKDRC